MAEKILSIKLNIDTSQGGKLFEVIKKVTTETEQLASSTSKLNTLEKQHVEAIQKIASEYARLKNIADNASNSITERSRGWNLAEANLAKAIEVSSRKFAEQSDIVRKSLEEQKAIRKRYDYLGEFTREQDARLAKLKQAQTTELSLINAKHAKEKAAYQAYEEAITRAALEFSTRRIAQAAAEADRIAQLRRNANLNLGGSNNASTTGRSNAAPVGFSYATGSITAAPVSQAANNFANLSANAGNAANVLRAVGGAFNYVTGATAQNTNAINNHTNAIHTSVRAHKNLFEWIAEVNIMYRAQNYILNNLSNAIHAIPKIGIELEATFASLAASTGSQAGAISAMRFLKEESDRTGIAIATLRETFRGFQASTSLAGESMQTTVGIFKSINSVVTGLHLPAEKASGIFNALAQIFNKTKVQSEELVKQLGNLIPGAFAAFAAANRSQFATSAILIAEMKKGTVFAHDTVERFATFLENRFSAAFAIASTGFNANIGRMQTSLTLLGEKLYKVTSSGMNTFVKGVTALANAVGSDTGLMVLGEAIKLIGAGITALALPAMGKFILSLFEVRTAEQAAAIAAGHAARANTLLSTSAVNAARSLEAQALATVGTTAASRGLSAILGFFANPTTIVIGLGLIAKEFYDIAQSGKEATRTLEDFLAADRRARLEKGNKQPTTSELKTTVFDDPNIQEKTLAIARLEIEAKQLAKRIEIIQKNGIGGPLESLNKEFFAKIKLINASKEALVRAIGGVADTIEASINANKPPPIDFLEGIENLTLENFDKRGKAIEAAVARFVKNNKAMYTQAVAVIKQATPPNLLPDNFSQEQYNNARTFLDAYNEGLALTKEQAEALANTTSKSVAGIYSLSSNYIKNQSDEMQSSTDITIAKLNASINELETRAAIAKAGNKPVDELGLINAIGDKQKAIAEERITLEKKLQQLQQNTLDKQLENVTKQTVDLTRVWKELQNLETAGKDREGQISRTGAIGKQQIQPSTLSQYINVPDSVLLAEVKAKAGIVSSKEKALLREFALSHVPEIANASFEYYKEQLTKYKGDFLKAAAAYNAGPGRVDKSLKRASKEGGNYLEYLPRETQNYVADLSSAVGAENKGAVSLLDTLTNVSQIQAKILSLTNEEAAIRNRVELQTTEFAAEQIKIAQQLNIEELQATGYNKKAELAQLTLNYEEQRLNLQNKGLASLLPSLDRIFESRKKDLELTIEEEGLTSKQLAAKNQLLEISGTAQQEFEANLKRLDVLYNSVDAKGKAILTQAERITALGNINAKFNVAKDKELTTPIDRAIPAVKRYEDAIKKSSNAMKEFGNISNAVYNASLEGVSRISGVTQQWVEAEKNLQDKRLVNEEKYTEAVKAVNEAKYVNPMIKMMDLYSLEKGHLEDIAKTKAESLQNTLGGIAQIAGATSSMFAQGSNEAKAFNLIALAGLTAKGASAILTQGEGDPYTAIPRMIAMAGIVANILATAGAGGFNFSGTPAAPSQEQMDKLNGTGTVLGDSSKASESITNIIDTLKSIHADEYVELRGINKGIQTLQGGITDTITKVFRAGGLNSLNVNSKSGLTGIGSLIQSGSGIGKFDPISNKILGGLFGVTKTTNIGTGIEAGGVSIGSILDGMGANARQFDVIQKSVKSWFKTSFSYAVQRSDLSEDIQKSLSDVFTSIGTTMLGLSKELGANLDDSIRSYIVPIISLNLKGLTGEEASKKLTAVLSANMDKMASDIFGPMLGQYQQLGEGMLETTVRIVSEIAVVKDAISTTGQVLTSNIIAVSDALVQVAGGLEEFQKQFEIFYDKFFTDAEKQIRLTERLGSRLAEVFTPDIIKVLAASREGYRQVMGAINLNTEAGQLQYSTLLELASAADQWYTSVYDVQNKLLDEAKNNLEKAYKAEADVLQQTIDKLSDFIKTLKDFRDTLVLGESSTFTPGQKYAEATRQYEETKSTLAMGPGSTADSKKLFEEAMAEVTGKAQEFLNTSRIYNASSQAYTNDFNKVLQDINDGIAISEGLKSDAEKQLDALNESVKNLIDLNESVLTVADILRTINNTLVETAKAADVHAQMASATATLQRQLTIEESNWIIDQVSKGTSTESIDSTVKRYATDINAQSQFANTATSVTPFVPEPVESSEWIAAWMERIKLATAGLTSPAQWAAWFNAEDEESKQHVNQLFYTGRLDGSHADGLDYVPFDGYKAELHKGERVLTAAQAKDASNTSQEILSELKYLREAVAKFNSDHNEGTGAIIQSNYDANDRAANKIDRSLTEVEKRKSWGNANKVSLS
jgi:hypothetical protein